MPGVKGRSGGHNRIPVSEHIERGTYRASRHGSAVLARAVPAWSNTSPTPPPKKLLAGLAPSGRSFVRDMFREHEITASESHVIRVAAEALDDAAAARAAGDMKATRTAVRQFLAALQRLGFPTAAEKR